MKTPIKWYGGKQTMATYIIRLFPPHRTYVEPFAGGAAVLFAKPLSSVEIINDLDGNIVNFFRVLRDDEKRHRLAEMLALTPYARDEHEFCRQNISDTMDDIERARMFFVLVRQSFNATFKESWSFSAAKNCASDFAKASKSLLQVASRLNNVQIENRPAIEVIKQFDRCDTLYFLDPPYVKSSRNNKSKYDVEMSDKQHSDLLTTIISLKGMVILSGYRTQLYDDALATWDRIDLTVPCHSSTTVNEGQSKTKPDRIECLWINPAARLEHVISFD